VLEVVFIGLLSSGFGMEN